MSSFDILSRQTALQRRLFLEASAGTGKTFTIEHLVVRLLLETEWTIEQLLVVTFTRAATRELKVRIRANLEKILSGGLSFEYLEGLTEKQREKIKTALLAFDQAQIFTIHGFCRRILQEFAFEAFVGLDLQEWEDQEERWAVLEFLRGAKCLSSQQWRRLLGSFRNDIDALAQKLLSLSDAGKPASFDDLLQLANQTLERLTPFSVAAAFEEARPHYKGMTPSVFASQASLLDQAVQRKRLLPEEFDCLLSEELFLEKINPENLKVRTAYRGHPALEQLSASLLPILEAARNPRKILQTVNHAWQQERRNLSRSYEKVAPDDLLKMVQERLSHPSFVAAVREKYRAAIVDEFQDTDPVQWKIFEALFFADPDKAVYLVGDPKQSIYAFRSADIYTFLDAARGFGIDQKAVLTTNYRSNDKLMSALNKLLCAKPWLDLPRLNQTLSVAPSAAAKTGEGDLCFMIAEGADGKRASALAVEEQFFAFIVHEVHQKKLEPASIAILVKDRFQALRAKKYLQCWQIPCVLYRGASLGDSLMVDLLLELIEASQGSASALKKVLLGPFVRMQVDRMTDEAVFKAKAIFAALADFWLREGFASFMARFLQTKILDRTVLQTLFAEESLYDDLMQIIEKILYISDPHQMMKALQLLKIQEVDERISAHPHGIQIMTVHASKGLEFETVFAVGLASRTPAEDKPDEILRELDAEKMRQFYVAVTRAKQRLYIPWTQIDEPCSLGEASPMELFCAKAQPDLSTFTHVHLNGLALDLRPYEEARPAALTPPPSASQFFKPLFLQSFTSLAHPAVEHKIVQDEALPAGPETGIVFHQILEKFFEQEWDLASLIAQELRGSHLEGHETAVEALIQKVLDLRLNGFCLRDIDRAKALPEMEFLFSTQESFLKGFIDLCFEHEGKYYLIDWKTNLLEDYTPQTLEKAMEEHDYLLQGKIYTEAFSRYLKLYGRSLGGIYFVFVRGPAAYHFLPEALNV